MESLTKITCQVEKRRISRVEDKVKEWNYPTENIQFEKKK